MFGIHRPPEEDRYFCKPVVLLLGQGVFGKEIPYLLSYGTVQDVAQSARLLRMFGEKKNTLKESGFLQTWVRENEMALEGVVHSFRK